MVIPSQLILIKLVQIQQQVDALTGEYRSEIDRLALQLAELTGSTVGVISEGANSAGLSYAGALPHRGPAGAAVDVAGNDLGQMLASPVKGLLLVNIEPEFDCADGVAAVNALAWCPSAGRSSTTSKPTTRLDRATRLSRRLTGYQSSPPGSGVPTEGITEGSSTSRSTVR